MPSREILKPSPDPSITNKGINALIAAASEGHSEIVGMLLASHRVDVNTKDKDGTNALMAAAIRGHKDVIVLEIVSQYSDQPILLYLVSTFGEFSHSLLAFSNGKGDVTFYMLQIKTSRRDLTH